MDFESALKLRSSRLLETGSGRSIEVCEFAQSAYSDAHSAMLEHVSKSVDDDINNDQIWLLEHERVYTQGTACQLQTLLPSDIPTIKTDRGGQITYHGPGQLILYPLLHLKPLGLGVKTLVASLEQAVIDTLASLSVLAERRQDAPGVYVDGAKIAALGLRIRRGRSYHGLSLNIDLDLSPFTNIDPCGYQGLRVTQLSDLVPQFDAAKVRADLVANFVSLI